MAELQTISAALGCAQLAWQACVFLRRVKDADKTAAELYERSTRLEAVLDGLKSTLKARERNGLAPRDGTDSEGVERIRRCIEASGKILRKVDEKVGGFNNEASGTALLDKVKIAFRSPGITRLQADLDARVQALQTELSILQLSDQAHTRVSISENHEEIRETLSNLREQLTTGNRILYALLRKQREKLTQDVEQAMIDEDTSESEAIQNLADCLQVGEEVHEHYTSQYAPDDRSIRFNGRVRSEQGRESPLLIATPVTEESGSIPLGGSSSSRTNLTLTDILDDEDEDDADIWPLDYYNSNIDDYHEKANKELLQGHYKQAELSLQSVIKYSEMRSRHYGVEFDDRIRLQEEVAVLYQKQHKWAEAVVKVHHLLRDSTDELVIARQNQILAEIYYDRHISKSGPALSNVTDDIDNAERHARRAFNKRHKLLKTNVAPIDEVERHDECIALLVRILEILDKTVEADGLTRFLSADSVLIGSSTLRRKSTNRPPSDIVPPLSKHEQLINSIRAGDSDAVQDILNEGEVDVEEVCSQKMQTPLMHAVEMSDETILHKLLGSGADVRKANKRGMTALHLAAGLGLHDMVQRLLDHDADIEARDRYEETALMKAVQNNQETTVEVLFNAGADLDTKNKYEYSLLHFSIRLPQPTVTSQLLGIAPDLKDAVDRAGRTALHHCADYEWIEQAKALLSHKNHVDVSATDSVGRTPLYFAATKPSTPRRESMVQLLVEYGAYVDEKRPPPKFKDYAALKPFQTPRRASKISRYDSMSTTGSIESTSTGTTGKLSRFWSAKMQRR